jgi:hypothetical protein
LLLPGFLSLGFLSFSTMEIHAQAAAPAKPQPPATILLIRRAEKLTDGRLDLSPTGFERARLLPTVFSPAGTRPDLPTPQVLFATHTSEHTNRPVQTVSPLAAQPCTFFQSTTASRTRTTLHLQPLY